MTTFSQPAREPEDPLPVVSSRCERPGCVTVYALLVGAGAVLIGFGGILVGIAEGSFGIVIGSLVLAMLQFLLARGIWQLRQWARVIILCLQGLSLLMGLIRVFFGDLDALFAVAVSGVIVFWLANNGDHFD